MDSNEANLGGMEEHREKGVSKYIHLDDMGRDNLTLWALQVHQLLQIIINRCQIIASDKRFTRRLKIYVAVFITAINISVYNIWLPARLQISETYIRTNVWWDRVEKVLYMLVDGALNMYFIRVVQKRLVRNGLTKYRSLVHFNMSIVGFSLSMDLLIITMMSLHNTFVYMQFHPLAYIVKLNIEMSMADLIRRIAKKKHNGPHNNSVGDSSNSSNYYATMRSRGTSLTKQNSTKAREYDNDGLGITTRVEFNNLVRPDAAYTVGATASHCAESSLYNSQNIYTTREFCVDFEDKSDQSPESSAERGEVASTSRTEYHDIKALER
ncbi:hypothetical protein F5Y14DRAFT_447689 [Nemania sp. NC0429]|nr:hypothetical protein F5Y14DRAFT_447689 [Nemania sp. NC0429]